MYSLHRLTLLVVTTLLTCALSAQAEIQVSVGTDQKEALYALGETVTFQVNIMENGTPLSSGELRYEISNDGAQQFDAGTRAVDGSPILFTGTLSAPGFLRCTVVYTDATGKRHVAVGAGGFEPLRIPASMAPPEDFDAFWAEKKALQAKLPMNPRLTPVKAKAEGVQAYDVQLDALGGAPVSGYYSRPNDATEKSLPAVLWLHGAGVRSSVQRDTVAAEGMLILDINAHGIPNGHDKDYYAALAKGEFKGYMYRGRESREDSYFLGMYFRILRALDFLTAQPEWDGQVLITIGSSQGGGQSLVAAGLDPRVTALIANVPAMCDHTAIINGWPRLVPRDGQGNPDPAVLQASRYFDAMNFATRTNADALVSVGFIDNTCRPTSVYAAYNNLTGEKQMLNKPLMAHAVPPEWSAMTLKFMKDHIAKMKK